MRIYVEQGSVISMYALAAQVVVGFSTKLTCIKPN